MIKRLTRLCNQVLEKGEVPSDWKDGIIVPISKRGDLKDCNYWPGMSLLSSVPGNVMAGIILESLEEAINNSLQQAGFRKSRFCCEQIFILRQIIEEVTALNIKLLITSLTSIKHSTVFTGHH